MKSASLGALALLPLLALGMGGCSSGDSSSGGAGGQAATAAAGDIEPNADFCFEKPADDESMPLTGGYTVLVKSGNDTILYYDNRDAPAIDTRNNENNNQTPSINAWLNRYSQIVMANTSLTDAIEKLSNDEEGWHELFFPYPGVSFKDFRAKMTCLSQDSAKPIPSQIFVAQLSVPFAPPSESACKGGKDGDDFQLIGTQSFSFVLTHQAEQKKLGMRTQQERLDLQGDGVPNVEAVRAKVAEDNSPWARDFMGGDDYVQRFRDLNATLTCTK